MERRKATAPQRLPVLPLKELVIFPRMVTPLLVGRPASIGAVEEALASDRPLFLCAQIDPAVDEPDFDDLRAVGVTSHILQTLRMPDDTMKVVVEGIDRATLQSIREYRGYLEAVVQIAPHANKDGQGLKGVTRAALTQFEEYARLSQRIAPEFITSLRGFEDPGEVADLICAHLPFRVEERQLLLDTINVAERLEQITTLLMRENEVLDTEQKVRERVREQMDRSQREYFLHEQLKAIHQELGNREEGTDELSELSQMVEASGMPPEVREKAEKELLRYERVPVMSPESAVIRTYIEWLAEMPWQSRTDDAIDLIAARRILDRDHYGLAKVKERILEFLAVRILSQSAKGPILCLVGPPGVGKTSLGESIARAMKRKFVRVSLGGIRDEAEIRGHRRTYVGSLPGRIVQSLKKVGVKNPVFLLDEIDKMSADFRGDPSSALLEVLDPAQNKTFSDHYLEVDFDLHEIFFITTANSEDSIPHALHDRMEVVRLSGYTPLEKEHIARNFLLPRQRQECGLSGKEISLPQKTIRAIIEHYTREAGVRELERKISQICRKVARKRVENPKSEKTTVRPEDLHEYLGAFEYLHSEAEITPRAGLAVGLAWTMAGGDILNIETGVMKGKGTLQLTGQLGDVMKESAHAVHTYLRARTEAFGLPYNFHQEMDLHVHVPEGGIPKDGPSAGTSIAVSMLSALRGEAPIAGVAMTGEITLRGRILAVGGIKEKLLAAHRSGIKIVLLPKDNEKDLEEVPEEVRKALRIELVSEMSEVIGLVFPSLAIRGAAPAKKVKVARR